MRQWELASKRELGSQLKPIVARLQAKIAATGNDGRFFMNVMRANGLGSHPAILRVLDAISSRGRRL